MKEKERYVVSLALSMALAMNESEKNKNSVSFIQQHVRDTKIRKEMLNNSIIDKNISNQNLSFSSSSPHHKILDDILLQWLFCRYCNLSSSKVILRFETILSYSVTSLSLPVIDKLLTLKSIIVNDLFLGVSSEHDIEFIKEIIKSEEFIRLYPRISTLMITCMVECINLLCRVDSLNPLDHSLIYTRSPLLTDILCQLLRYVVQDKLIPFPTTISNGNSNTFSQSRRYDNDDINRNDEIIMSINTKQQSLQWVAEQLSDAMEISYRLPLVHEKLTNLALSFFSH